MCVCALHPFVSAPPWSVCAAAPMGVCCTSLFVFPLCVYVTFLDGEVIFSSDTFGRGFKGEFKRLELGFRGPGLASR